MPTKLEVRNALSEYLQSLPWDFLFTITYKPKYQHWNKPDYAQRRVWTKMIESCTFAPERAFIVTEPHQLGHFHHHGLVKFPTFNSTNDVLADQAKRVMIGHCGWSKFDRINSSGRVSDYCAKYIIRNDNLFDYDFLGKAVNWQVT